MLVHKFGGTSVGSAGRFEKVVEIINQTNDRDAVVVVSAMSGTTTVLIEAARAAARGDSAIYREASEALRQKHIGAVEALLAGTDEHEPLVVQITERLQMFERLCASIEMLGEVTMRGHDAVASIGEDLSSRILAALFRVRGRPSQAVNATRVVRTDDHYGSARPDMAATRELTQTELVPLVQQGVLPIVTGYIGSTEGGVTTTLGRGGSDYTAAILGVALDADQVWIWTDVPGILTADPKLVPEAHTLPELSYREAEELAYFGADVLHPKTVSPLAAAGVPLRILDSYSPNDPGTAIVCDPQPGRTTMPAIISTEGLSLIGVNGNGAGWSLQFASRALNRLAEAGLDVFMFSQAFTERSLNLVVRQQDSAHCIRLLESEFEREIVVGNALHVSTEEQVAAVSVVGMPDAPKPIAPQAFAALGKLGLRVISVAQASSTYSVSFILSSADVKRAVPHLHRELGL